MYRLRELAIEASEHFALGFCVFAFVVLYVKKSVNSFSPVSQAFYFITYPRPCSFKIYNKVGT